jgi:uncharacterized membrane protein SpoIIM required for sporulation
MREASFLAKNEKKWRKVEQILDKKSQLHPDESADLFVELTDDLSYSRTFYPKSIATRYLNLLTAGIYQKINRKKREKWSRLLSFWRYEVPIAMGRNQRKLIYAFSFFLLAVIIGVVSTHYDDTFARVVLGDEYVDMTLKNIEEGDPMAVYKDSNSHGMFLGITTNNIRVASYTLIAGILFSLGTYYFLFVNGVMLGCFQYFFLQKGLFWDSFLTIWIHGTIEISCIVMAGAAGITLGNSLLFPGTLPRKNSLIKGGKQALKMSVGIVPLIILAGFLESFITRLTESPLFFRAGIIGASFLFIVWYFVYYPHQLLKKRFLES